MTYDSQIKLKKKKQNSSTSVLISESTFVFNFILSTQHKRHPARCSCPAVSNALKRAEFNERCSEPSAAEPPEERYRERFSGSKENTALQMLLQQ